MFLTKDSALNGLGLSKVITDESFIKYLECLDRSSPYP